MGLGLAVRPEFLRRARSRSLEQMKSLVNVAGTLPNQRLFLVQRIWMRAAEAFVRSVGSVGPAVVRAQGCRSAQPVGIARRRDMGGHPGALRNVFGRNAFADQECDLRALWPMTADATELYSARRRASSGFAAHAEVRRPAGPAPAVQFRRNSIPESRCSVRSHCGVYGVSIDRAPDHSGQ